MSKQSPSFLSVPIILDFCAGCGALQPEGKGLSDDPYCSMCGVDVTDRGKRIQGLFSREDAAILQACLL